MTKKKKQVTVTIKIKIKIKIKINRDGTQAIKSTGGYDLRKLFRAPGAEPLGIQHHPPCSVHTGKQGCRCDYDCTRDFPQPSSSTPSPKSQE